MGRFADRSGTRLLLPATVIAGVVGLAALAVRRVERLVKSEPVLLYRSGFLPAAMRRARVTEDEIRQAARSSGKASLDDVAAVVLETDGSFSVVPGPTQGGP